MSPWSSDDEAALVERARQGDEDAFGALVDRHHGAAVRLASQFVKTPSAAQDAAQDAWLGVLAGLRTFEGRSSFRTWLFSIVVNCAKRRGQKEFRDVPLSAFDALPESGPAVPAERFAAGGKWPDHWADPPTPRPDDVTHRRELLALVEDAAGKLASGQREVFTLRDMMGLSSEEACTLLGISESNQRVLLHRARSRVRAALEHVVGWAP
jgi:RNA polymerase sigma-70 factor (ECF subfamily)